MNCNKCRIRFKCFTTAKPVILCYEWGNKNSGGGWGVEECKGFCLNKSNCDQCCLQHLCCATTIRERELRFTFVFHDYDAAQQRIREDSKLFNF